MKINNNSQVIMAITVATDCWIQYMVQILMLHILYVQVMGPIADMYLSRDYYHT